MPSASEPRGRSASPGGPQGCSPAATTRSTCCAPRPMCWRAAAPASSTPARSATWAPPSAARGHPAQARPDPARCARTRRGRRRARAWPRPPAAELRMAGGRAPRRARAPVDRLTPGERRVAELAAAGQQQPADRQRAVHHRQGRGVAPRQRLPQARRPRQSPDLPSALGIPGVRTLVAAPPSRRDPGRQPPDQPAAPNPGRGHDDSQV